MREQHAATPPTRAVGWDRMVLGVLGLVAVYGLGLVVAGLFLADQVFDRLGFGPADGHILTDDARQYLRLVYAIVGALIVGWMVALASIALGPLRRRERWAWWAMASGLGAWFVLDSGVSLALGYVGHAAFNLVFAVVLAVPLAAIRATLGSDGPSRA